MVTKVDFEKCSNFINKVREDRFNKVKARQVSKFNLLQNKNKQREVNRQTQANNRTIEGANANLESNNNEQQAR